MNSYTTSENTNYSECAINMSVKVACSGRCMVTLDEIRNNFWEITPPGSKDYFTFYFKLSHFAHKVQVNIPVVIQWKFTVETETE